MRNNMRIGGKDMKKWFFIILSAVLVVAVLCVAGVFFTWKTIEYEVMDEWNVEWVYNKGETQPGNAELVAELLDIDAEDAVKIARKAWSSRYILDNFEVYYDEENEWYFVTAWYMLPKDRFDCLMIKWFDDPDDYIWENTCSTLIDKNTGAVLNMDGWGIAK